MRIVLADDHVMLRDGLKPYLRDLDPQAEVLEAGSYPELFDVMAIHQPVTLALVDLRMPGMDGFSGLRLLRHRWPETRLTVLSSVTDQKTILDVLAAGAVGFIPKRLSAGAMLNALQLVMAGERFLPAVLLSGETAELRVAAVVGNDDEPADPGSVLTQREREILRLLRDGLPNKAIARQLNLSEVTVKSHLCHVFRKLGVQNRVQAARLSLQSEDW